ncbi:hypothetical protein B0813_000358 [Candidatus Fervidibacteria bacterium JGI MDM2 SSWTFF-3-K9]
MKKASQWLQSLRIEEPQTTKGVFTVFPLTVSETNGRDYLTLDEAFRQGLVVIPESGRVPEIVVVVKGEKPVLIVEGEVIVGGWQNRTVNISLLLEAGKEHRIPVSCIEAGRWSSRRTRYPFVETREREIVRDEFEVAAYLAHSQLRRRKTETATRHFLLTGSPVAEQRDVWAEVSRELIVAGVASPTEDATTFYEHHRASIEDLLNPIKTLPNQVGAVVAIGQTIVGLEAFDHPQTWNILRGKVLYGYAAEALEFLWRQETSGLVAYHEAEAFREKIALAMEGAAVKPAPVGMGEHLLLEGGLVGGFALVHNGKVRHMFAFPKVHR